VAIDGRKLSEPLIPYKRVSGGALPWSVLNVLAARRV